MRKLAAVFILSLLAVGQAALPAAGADEPPLPLFHSKPKLVIPTELAGVRLGMKIAAIRGRWGDPGTCPHDTYATCIWGGVATGSLRVETAASDTIEVAELHSREAETNYRWHSIPTVAPPLSKIKSREGIGIGSKLPRVMKRYPGGRKMINRAEDWIAYEVSKRGSTMVFEASLSKAKKIIRIGLQKSHVS